MSSNYRTREVAKRAFATELRIADHMFKEDDDEYAPSYLLLPSGEKMNRIFFIGTLVEKEDKGSGFSFKITDSTGKFVAYAGQYNQDAADTIRNIDPPQYVAVTGKPDTFETDEGDVITTIRPESVSVVSESERMKWMVETAEQTLERIETNNTEYAQQSADHYDESDIEDLTDGVISALETVQTDL